MKYFLTIYEHSTYKFKCWFLARKNSNFFNLKLNAARFTRKVVNWDFLTNFQTQWLAASQHSHRTEPRKGSNAIKKSFTFCSLANVFVFVRRMVGGVSRIDVPIVKLGFQLSCKRMHHLTTSKQNQAYAHCRKISFLVPKFQFPFLGIKA